MSSPEILSEVKAGENRLSSSCRIGGFGMAVNVGAHNRVFRIVAAIVMRCWAVAGAAILACLLLYWAYGGFMAFLLLCFATTGKCSLKKTSWYFYKCTRHIIL
jgi:hypothetical protein